MNTKNIIYDSITLIETIIGSGVPYRDLPQETRERLLSNRDHLVISLDNKTHEILSDEDVSKIKILLNNIQMFIQ